MESSSQPTSPLSGSRPQNGGRAWLYLALIANWLLPLTLISTLLLGPPHSSGAAGVQLIWIGILIAAGGAFTYTFLLRTRPETVSLQSRTSRDDRASDVASRQTWTGSASTTLARAQEEALPICVAYLELDAAPSETDRHSSRSNISVCIGLEDCKFRAEDVCSVVSDRRIAIVWFNCGAVQGLQRSRQIIRVIRDGHSGSTVPLTASVGLIENPGYAGVCLDHIEPRVLERLQAAKSSGGDTVLCSSLNPSSSQRASLAA